MEVGEIERGPFENFLGERFESGDRRVARGLWDAVFALSEGNPSDTQQLCAALWDTTEPGTLLASEHMGGALMHIFATERKGFESIIKSLTDNQLKCLRALARIGGEQPQSKRFLAESGIKLPASVKRSLTRLENLGVVYGSDRAHRFFDPFFRQWLLTDMAERVG